MPILRVESIFFSYGDSETVKDFSIEIGESEAVAIMGPSGSGKSTLLRIISGLEKPISGSCEIDGHEIHGIQPKVFLGFQDYDAYPWYSVGDNVALASSGTTRKHAQHEDIDRILSSVGLRDSVDKYPKELSGGMRKRLALARCLGSGARLIMLDEPFSSLDSRSRRELQLLTKKLVRNSRCGLIICTHDPYEAAVVADRVFICSGKPLTVLDTIDVRRLPGSNDPNNYRFIDLAVREIYRSLNRN